MPEFLLGMGARIYQGAAGAALGALTVMNNVRDVALNMEAGEADYTTRSNSGWRATASTLREMSVDFEMVWKPGDAGFEAVRTTFLANGTLELAILDQARTVTTPAGEGASGPQGAFSITSFTRGEPLEEVQTVSVTAKLSLYTTWIIDGAPE